MQRRLLTLGAVIAIFAVSSTTVLVAKSEDSGQSLKVREAVWKSWFANDASTLKELVPPGTIVISAGEAQWKHQGEVLQSAVSTFKHRRLTYPH